MALPADRVDYHLDQVLRASGSGLRFYSITRVVNAMREAMKAAMEEAAGKSPTPSDKEGGL